MMEVVTLSVGGSVTCGRTGWIFAVTKVSLTRDVMMELLPTPSSPHTQIRTVTGQPGAIGVHSEFCIPVAMSNAQCLHGQCMSAWRDSRAHLLMSEESWARMVASSSQGQSCQAAHVGCREPHRERLGS